MCPTPPSPDWLPLATFTVRTAAVAVAALWQAATARKRHEEQTIGDRDRRIIESFAKAGEQLGNDKLETRLVGIYTLERIAGESKCEYWPIMETLTAFVRQRAPWSDRRPPVEQQPRRRGGIAPPEPQIRPETDIQAVLTVLGRRDKTAPKRYRKEPKAGRYLDLAETDLRGADLRGAHLEWAHLAKAHLEGASLTGGHLESAGLVEAHLQGANLWGAHLEGADLPGGGVAPGADLRGAHLERAVLLDAHLQGAYLGGAYLEGADLTGAVGLTQEQLGEAFGDATTKVSEELRPPHWPAAAPDAPDNSR